jgi:hypothetical protein
MLGFSDYLFGIKKWRPIQRNTHSWLNKKILLFAFVAVFIISSLFSLFFYKKSLCNDGGLFNLENKKFSVDIEKKSLLYIEKSLCKNKIVADACYIPYKNNFFLDSTKGLC